ncbi:MAG: hypothetical protein AAF687_11125 [Pseudomonadota bacterium]
MRTYTAIVVAGALASCAHAKPPLGPEASFVACLAEKQPDMIAKIRDAKGEQEFLAALMEGREICPTKTDKLSMGKLFNALNAHKQNSAEGAE